MLNLGALVARFIEHKAKILTSVSYLIGGEGDSQIFKNGTGSLIISIETGSFLQKTTSGGQ